MQRTFVRTVTFFSFIPGLSTLFTKSIENVELAMQEGYSTAPDKVRALGFGAGMGLPNIKKYTDEMKIDTEKDVGTTISLKVYTAH